MGALREAIGKGMGLSAPLDAWREAFYAGHWGDSVTSKRQAFLRVRQALVGKGIVTPKNDKYSIKSSDYRENV